MNVQEFLINVRDLIIDPKNWIKGTYARDELGSIVSYNNPKACKFCLMGAINNVALKDNNWKICIDAINLLETTLDSYSGVTKFNDHHTHAEVLGLLDKAIATC